MLNAPDFTPALKWFSGKSLEKAKAALEMLTASVKNGAWLPGHSRTVRATLSKANLAQKLLTEKVVRGQHGRIGDQLENIAGQRFQRYDMEPLGEEQEKACNMGWSLNHYMYFGQLSNMSKLDFALLRKYMNREGNDPRIAKIVEAGEQFAADMAPLAQAMDQLDITRPKPVFTSLGVSGTITDTFTDARLDLDLSKIYYPEMVMKQVERINAKGEKYIAWVCMIIWPEGVVHGRSRFVGTERNFDKCHSCGHAIKNPFNWVPVLINNKAGVPHSFWVGRDCAKTVFGIDVTGDLEYTNR